MIVIDWNPHATKFHPENAFVINRWDGDDSDTTLFDLAAFLKSKTNMNYKEYRAISCQFHIKPLILILNIAVVTADVDDVRDVMTYYKVKRHLTIFYCL